MFRLLQVEGEDAASFLQGQLTQDVRQLAPGRGLLGAWCNPKGRVITVLRILDLDGAVGLVLPTGLAERVASRLSMYRLRAKVDIRPAPDWQAVAVAAPADLESLAARGLLPERARGAGCHAHGITTLELGGHERGVELYGTQAAIAGLALSDPLSEPEWHKALIDAGIPTITADTSEQYTPHMLNLDRIGAVSFDKGCYTGQEIVARTEHRGQSKRRLRRYRLETGEAHVGDRLLHESGEAGEVVNAAGPDLLAVARIESHEAPLTVNGGRAVPVPLPYDV